MTEAQSVVEYRRRVRNVFVFLPLAGLTLCGLATQFVAWRLNYRPFLGAPVFQHVYWPWSVIGWWRSPWEPQVDTTFQFVMFGVMVTVMLGAIMFLKSGQKRPKPIPDIHGTARFRTEDEIRKSTLFPHGKPGIIVGAWKDRRGALHYLTDSGEGHVLATGPSRIGKTMSTLIPTLLSYPYSMVVFDPKGELYRLTAGWRANEGDNVVMRFAPADMENTVAWNPFDSIDPGSLRAFGDVADIVQQIVDPQGKGFDSDHWAPSAANLLNGLALYLVMRKKCSLKAILSTLDSKEGITSFLNALSKHPISAIAEIARGTLATPDRERGSILSTARRMLMIYRDPILGRNTSRSDFALDDLVHHTRPVTLYVEMPPNVESRVRPFARLVINQIMNRLMSFDGGQRYPFILAIEELRSLRKMEPLEIFLTKGAGAGMRGFLVVQDYQDIVAEYGQHESITSNCNVLTAHAPNNVMTAEWLSKKTGQTTRTVEQVSESQQRGQRSTNRSYQSVAGPLLTSDEVSRLRLPQRDSDDKIIAPGEVLIFQAGEHVIRGTQSLAFRDAEFSRRMAIPAPPTMRTR